jgi:hypothetical protein
MLCDKYRMSSHWCLFAVILGKIRGNPGMYLLICVIFDGFEAFGGDLISIFF